MRYSSGLRRSLLVDVISMDNNKAKLLQSQGKVQHFWEREEKLDLMSVR